MSKGKLKQKNRKANESERWSKRPIVERRELPDETPMVMAMASALMAAKMQRKTS